MILIPLPNTAPDYTFSINLANQACQIRLRQNGGNMYMDLSYNQIDVITCRICRNRQRLLLDAQYHGFVGDFFFNDSQGDTDPQYTGLGTRYFLYYLTATELAA